MDPVGMGYVGADMASGVQLSIDRLHETRGELTGELTVSRAPDGSIMSPSRLNLTSLSARNTHATNLKKRLPDVDTAALLEEFTRRVLTLVRAGEPIVMVGKLPPRPEPPMVVKPILHQGPNIMFGSGGTGKSTLAGAIGVSVQTGRPLLPGWDVVCPGPIYILDWESSWEDWNDTIAAIAKGLGIPPIEVVYRRCSGPLDRAVYEHAAHVSRTGTQLVIVDSVTWAMRAQNDGGGIDEPIKRLFDAIRQIGSNWLLIDHMNKVDSRGEEGSESRAPKGGQAKTDAARNTLELRRSAPKDPDGTMHLALINRKVNRSDEHDPIGIRIRRPGGALVFEMEEVQLADPVTAQATRLQDKIRSVLRKGERMTAEEIAGELGLGGSDPAATVRVTAARYPRIFAKDTSGKGPQRWYLVDLDHESASAKHVSQDVSQGRPIPKHPPYGGVTRGVSARLPEPFVSEDRWAGLIDLAERRTLTVDPELANDDG